MSPHGPSPETIRDTIRRYFAALETMDEPAWLATFAPDAVTHDPVGGMPVEGRASLRAFFSGITGEFAELRIMLDHVFVSGDGAAVKFSAHVAGKAGGRASTEGIDVFAFDAEGRIRRIWGYWDPVALMAHLKG